MIKKTPFDSMAVPVIKSFREMVYDRIREGIISGELEEGSVFTDAHVASKFNVSRMPVREALQKLETEDLLERLPSQGFRVKKLYPTDIAHIFSISKALECLALEYAAHRVTDEEIDALQKTIDDAKQVIMKNGDREKMIDALTVLAEQFNLQLINLCKAPRLVQMIERHRELLQRFGVVRTTIAARVESAFEPREEIVKSLRTRDPKKCRKSMAQHMDLAFRINLVSLGIASDVNADEYIEYI
jgi:DNA-binding GntR family transcriptional regulator